MCPATFCFYTDQRNDLQHGYTSTKNATDLLISDASNYLTFLTLLYVAKPKTSTLCIVKQETGGQRNVVCQVMPGLKKNLIIIR